MPLTLNVLSSYSVTALEPAFSVGSLCPSPGSHCEGHIVYLHLLPPMTSSLSSFPLIVRLGFYWFFKTEFLLRAALEPVLELALVDQACLELTEICLPLPPECWD